MKLFVGLVASTSALSDAEFAKFGCRSGQYYQYGKGDGSGQGVEQDAVEWNEYASEDNNWAGCFPDQRMPCYRTEHQCVMETDNFTANNGVVRHVFEMNSIPDHHAWGMSGAKAFIAEKNVAFRLPKAPVLLSEEEGRAQGAGAGTIGFAINGVAMYKPYNSNCCDAVYDELLSMDYCMGHPGNGHYHYHFLAYGDAENAYGDCLMSCNAGEVGEIVGIALDGFPFYGPMQYYSAREGKVYNDPANCDDCELTQVNAFHTDICGGIEVADGDASVGGQYRYIISNLFPYTLQCWRGDMSKSQQSSDGTADGTFRKINFQNKCGVHSEGIEGGTWDDEEHGWRGGGCEQFDPEWVEEYGCTAGNCPYSFTDFRNGIGHDFGYPRASWSTFSEVYFTCTAPPTTTQRTTTSTEAVTEPPPEPTTTVPRSTTTPVLVTEPEPTEVTEADDDSDDLAPAPTGEAGKWQRCDELDGVFGGEINCAKDLCTLTCMDGSEPVGPPKTKCVKNDDDTFSWTKDLGSCPVEAEPTTTRPRSTTTPETEPTRPVTEPEPTRPVTEPEPTRPVTEPEATRPEAPAPTGEDGKWQKCEELDGVMGGVIECAVDTCLLTCDDGSRPDGSAKTKCIKNADKTFSWSKDLGSCPVSDADAGDDGDDEEVDPVDPVEPETPDAPAPTGEDGKWQRCDALDGVMGGTINCAVDTCRLTCDDGSDPDGSAKTKCVKNADKTFSWSKRLGTCAVGGGDDSEVDPVDPTEPEAPAPTGEDGKWQKCDAIDGVIGGAINCAVDTCRLTCNDGSDPDGSAKTKCVKNADKTFSWSKTLGTCSVGGDNSDDETEPVDEETDENPGCKDVGTMIADDNLAPTCKMNNDGQYQCKLQCADGLLFNGKKGKTNTKLFCKCNASGKCKWKNSSGKVINKATVSGYTCE